jgi:hypothetical protein
MATNELYMETLKVFSSSHMMLYGTRSLEKPDYISDFEESFIPFQKRLRKNEGHMGGSIQVLGPPGYGKSAVVKLISQEVRKGSPAVLVEYSLTNSISDPPTMYGMQVSFIHQAISQMPSMFRPVENSVAQMLSQKPWTEEGVLGLLTELLHHSNSVDSLIVIYGFDKWPMDIRLWWSGTLGSLLDSCVVNFTFIFSSSHHIDDLGSFQTHEKLSRDLC